MELSFLLIILLLVTPSAIELYVWTGVLGCGQPISMRVCRMGNIAFVVMKRPASLSSASEDMTNLIIWAMVRMDPLSQLTGSSPDRKMWAPDRLRYLETLSYAASEFPASIMSMSQ